jgi:hypothetical protein
MVRLLSATSSLPLIRTFTLGMNPDLHNAYALTEIPGLPRRLKKARMQGGARRAE